MSSYYIEALERKQNMHLYNSGIIKIIPAIYKRVIFVVLIQMYMYLNYC